MSAQKFPPVRKPSTHLLSEQDLACIAQRGAPEGIRSDLIQIDDAGRLIFSMRGLHFYRHALAQYGLDAPLSGLKTEADVLRLHVDLSAAAFSHLVRQLDADWLKSEDVRQHVQGLVKGALDGITQATQRLRAHTVVA
ncbi:MAG: hypothetical protein QM742_04300 [Aquabacterium sp.]